MTGASTSTGAPPSDIESLDAWLRLGDSSPDPALGRVHMWEPQMNRAVTSLEEFDALESRIQRFMDSLDTAAVGDGSTVDFERQRRLAYQLTSAMNELAWEAWDRPLIPELGLPDAEGPFGYAEPCAYVTLVMSEHDPEATEASIERAAEQFEKNGLFIARVIFSEGDEEASRRETDDTEADEEPVHHTVGRFLRRLPWAR